MLHCWKFLERLDYLYVDDLLLPAFVFCATVLNLILIVIAVVALYIYDKPDALHEVHKWTNNGEGRIGYSPYFISETRVRFSWADLENFY